MTDILAKIDAATAGLCACGCDQPLPDGGLSAWFTGEDCQRRWHAARTDSPREVPGATPDYHNADAGVDVLAGMQYSIRVVIEFGQQLGRIAGPAMARLRELAEEVQRQQGIEAAPTDPMERALWLRKNRNTGPKPVRRAPRSLGVGRR